MLKVAVISCYQIQNNIIIYDYRKVPYRDVSGS